jgi:hypothetical protein
MRLTNEFVWHRAARAIRASLLFAVAQDVHDGDADGKDAQVLVVDVVSAWWSVCRCGFLADRGAAVGFVDDGLVGCAGGQQRGDGEPVVGPGQASCAPAR